MHVKSGTDTHFPSLPHRSPPRTPILTALRLLHPSLPYFSGACKESGRDRFVWRKCYSRCVHEPYPLPFPPAPLSSTHSHTHSTTLASFFACVTLAGPVQKRALTAPSLKKRTAKDFLKVSLSNLFLNAPFVLRTPIISLPIYLGPPIRQAQLHSASPKKRKANALMSGKPNTSYVGLS